MGIMHSHSLSVEQLDAEPLRSLVDMFLKFLSTGGNRVAHAGLSAAGQAQQRGMQVHGERVERGLVVGLAVVGVGVVSGFAVAGGCVVWSARVLGHLLKDAVVADKDKPPSAPSSTTAASSSTEVEAASVVPEVVEEQAQTETPTREGHPKPPPSVTAAA